MQISMGNQEKRISRRQKELRINLICAEIEKGSSYAQIQQKLQDLPQVRRDAICESSLINVQRAIGDLPFIKEVVQTIPNSPEDTVDKHDLKITLDQEISPIGIQVKSSIYGVLDFYQKIDQDYFNAKEILIERKTIVLNGQLPDDIIKQNFLNQLTLINHFHQNFPY